jgi:flagellar biosynthesis/type III secretory pathway M-ring protein FliF/YscJ
MIDQTLYTLIPLFFLFALFMVGFYFAWTDFRPRIIRDSDNETFSISAFSSIEPAVKKRELSMSELGLDELGNKAHLPIHIQRKQKMSDSVRNYAIDSPELAATVIKKWLKE